MPLFSHNNKEHHHDHMHHTSCLPDRRSPGKRPAAGRRSATHPLVFDATRPQNDLQGSLLAGIQFAQSQILPAHPRRGTTNPASPPCARACCWCARCRPATRRRWHSRPATAPASCSAASRWSRPPACPKPPTTWKERRRRGRLHPGPGTSTVINSSSELARLSDPSGAFLLGKLQPHALVTIQTADGRWVRDIHLPREASLEGKMVRLASNAGYNSTVYFSGRQVTISRGQSQQFKFVRGQWIRDGELENNGITYASDAWSAVLPAEWILPGLTLRLSQGI